MKIKLTDSEWAILEHRLDLTDCLAECYADTAFADAEREGKTMTDEQHQAAYQAAECAAAKLNSDIRANRQIEANTLTPLDKWILTECLEGNTFFAGNYDGKFWGEMPRAKVLAALKAGRSLQRKLNEAGIAGNLCLE